MSQAFTMGDVVVYTSLIVWVASPYISWYVQLRLCSYLMIASERHCQRHTSIANSKFACSGQQTWGSKASLRPIKDDETKTKTNDSDLSVLVVQCIVCDSRGRRPYSLASYLPCNCPPSTWWVRRGNVLYCTGRICHDSPRSHNRRRRELI